MCASQTIRRSFCRNAKLLGNLLLVIQLLNISRVFAAQAGLDSATPVGAYFNGVFPSSKPTSSGTWTSQNAFPNLSFRHPIRLVPEPGSNNLFVIGKEGYVWSFDNNPATPTKSLFLNITSKVQVTDNTGLVGIAFHPEWGQAGSPNRGYFYLYYYYSPAPAVVAENVVKHGYNRLSRFTKPDGQTTADPNSELVLIQQYDRHDWHGGGQMFFGPDGFLYLPIGDEGNDLDFYGTAQLRNKGLNGGVMRIDVNNDTTKSHAIRRQPLPGGAPPVGWPASFSANYMIPNDNPWQHPDGSQLEEYWTLGIRSPHTMMQDPVTDRIYLGDVGQGAREEIDLILKGGNYQWAYREGNIAVAGKTKPSPFTGTEQTPIHAYDRTKGVCIICGPVYRGSQLGPALRGQLLFTDHEYTRVWALPLNSDGTAASATATDLGITNIVSGFHQGVVSWGIDHQFEPYLIKIGNGYVDSTSQGTGKILKLVPAAGTVPDPPGLLSQLGTFSSLTNLTPAAGFIPYQPIEGFWSDGSEKHRWICIPNDGTPSSATERITNPTDPTAPWEYPDGTVLMKQFNLPVDDINPSARKKIETRFLIKGAGGLWYGLSYRWQDDESDAYLINTSETRNFTIPTTSGTRNQTWSFPNRSDCFTCHVSSAGTVLGLKPHQLNGDLFYPSTGRTANQLHTLTSIGLLSPGWSEGAISGLPRAVRHTDFTASLEQRAKSYLDANCSYCHRTGGVQPKFDLRFTTALNDMGIINGMPVKDYPGLSERIISPRNTAASVIHARANLIGGTGNLTQMPPLGKNMIDTDGVLVLQEWISTLEPPFWPGTNTVVRELYDGTNFATLNSTTNVTLPTGSWAADPIPGGLAGFSVRWSAHVSSKKGDTWTFGVTAPQGGNFRLYLGGTLLIDRWTTAAANATYIADIVPPVDYPLMVLEFKDTTVPGSISNVQYRNVTESGTLAAIPATAFFQPGAAPQFPFATNDHASLALGGTRLIPLLANDIDDNILPSSVVIVEPPSHGTLTIDAAGIATYTHHASAGFGTDSFLYNVLDTAGNPSNRAAVTLQILPHDQLWRNQYFTPTEQADPLVGGWLGDADADGLSNLLEYGFGSLPRDHASAPTVTTEQVDISGVRYVEVTYPRDPAATVIIAPETSSTMSSWNAAEPGVTLSHPTPQQTRLRFPLLPGSAKFGRIRLELAE